MFLLFFEGPVSDQPVSAANTPQPTKPDTTHEPTPRPPTGALLFLALHQVCLVVAVVISCTCILDASSSRTGVPTRPT